MLSMVHANWSLLPPAENGQLRPIVTRVWLRYTPTQVDSARLDSIGGAGGSSVWFGMSGWTGEWRMDKRFGIMSMRFNCQGEQFRQKLTTMRRTAADTWEGTDENHNTITMKQDGTYILVDGEFWKRIG